MLPRNALYAALVSLAVQSAFIAPAQAAGTNDDQSDPASLKIEDLVACKHDVPTWNGFAFWFSDSAEARAQLGMTKVKSDNPMLSQYHLIRPVTVFGHQTDTIVFSSSGPLAVLSGVSAPDMAKQLGVTPALDVPAKFLGEKVVSEKPFDGGSPQFQGTERITLNVSTVSNLPGKVLAGCSYRITMKDD